MLWHVLGGNIMYKGGSLSVYINTYFSFFYEWETVRTASTKTTRRNDLDDGFEQQPKQTFPTIL